MYTIYSSYRKNYIIVWQVVFPSLVTFPVQFDVDLSDKHSEKFRKAKSSIEAILFKAFIKVLAKSPTSIEVISFA